MYREPGYYLSNVIVFVVVERLMIMISALKSNRESIIEGSCRLLMKADTILFVSDSLNLFRIIKFLQSIISIYIYLTILHREEKNFKRFLRKLILFIKIN